MSEIKNGGLDQYGAGPFKQQEYGTAGTEGVKEHTVTRSLRQPHIARFSHTSLTDSHPVYDLSAL